MQGQLTFPVVNAYAYSECLESARSRECHIDAHDGSKSAPWRHANGHMAAVLMHCICIDRPVCSFEHRVVHDMAVHFAAVSRCGQAPKMSHAQTTFGTRQQVQVAEASKTGLGLSIQYISE